jgi:hypothetical protein
MGDSGNVVIGYTSDCTLMLDCDNVRAEVVIPLVEEYAKFHDLGSVLVMLSSDKGQMDLDLRLLKNFSIIFGKHLNFREIKWHIQEALRLELIDEAFAKIREFGSITIRVTAKNDSIPPPKIFRYFSNGDDTGIMEFLEFWAMCRKMGRLEYEREKNQA